MSVHHRTIIHHIDSLMRLQDQLFRDTVSPVLQAYHEGACNMARSIREYVAIDQKLWSDVKDEEATEDARLDRIAEDKEQERFSDESSY